MSVEKLLQVDPADVLHRDVELIVGSTQLVNLDDVLVNEVGDELGFADEHTDEFFVS